MALPQIALVVARGSNGVIGNAGGLPWRIRSDLQRFKAVTIGKPCIMGRKTWESLPLRPLPGRLNVVLTKDESYDEDPKAKGCIVCTSLDDALSIAREQAKDDEVDEICVIGGSAIFELLLPRAKRLYITEVDAAPDGDVFFPEFNSDDWQETLNESHLAGEKDDHACTFRTLERR